MSKFIALFVALLFLTACTVADQQKWADAYATAVAPQPQTEPAEWDQDHSDDTVDDGAVSPAPAETPVPCLIAGNIGAHGAKIYHLPNQANYGRIRINPAKGERWFCSEQEAVDAGWRKAQR